MGEMVVPLQPQTGNGGSHRERKPAKGFAVWKKVVTFAEPTPLKVGAVRERTLK